MSITIDANFPGGNVGVEKIDGDDVFLHQDLRDTRGWWFYWCFRVRGAAGRTLAFHFTNKDVIGVRGPAVSLDRGATWTWMGRKLADGPSFRYSFPREVGEARFGFGMTYTEQNLRKFLSRYAHEEHLHVATLCRSEKGRDVERLRVGRLDGHCTQRVLLTCRHHACEMMANYAMEGIVEATLADTENGQWLRENVEFLIVPFVDKDGVENGDQGKNRKPRDHGRDYEGRSIYPSTQALREFVPVWSNQRLRLAMDMHCPWIRGEGNERIFFVEQEDEKNKEELKKFSAILASVRTGPLPYGVENNLPFGQGWNTARNRREGKSCSRWAGDLPGIRLATTVEIPYANAGGEPVTAESARAFGGDLARALLRFLNRTD